MQQWFALSGFVLLVYLLWTIIHEASHVLAANEISPVKDVRFWFYPHKDENGKFYFARVKWSWEPWPIASDLVLGTVYLAPRIPDFFATLLFPHGYLFPSPWCYVWYIFWGGGLIDLFVGSLGIRKYSDLQISSTLLKLNPWTLRLCGFFMIAMSLLQMIMSNTYSY